MPFSVPDAPATKADPSSAIQLIAFDRNAAGHQGIHHALSGILEAALMDHAPGRSINDPARITALVDVGHAEGKIDQRMSNLCRIPHAPVWLTDPVAELQPVLPLIQSRAADKAAVSGKRDCVVATTMFARASAFHELLRVRPRVG